MMRNSSKALDFEHLYPDHSTLSFPYSPPETYLSTKLLGDSDTMKRWDRGEDLIKKAPLDWLYKKDQYDRLEGAEWTRCERPIPTNSVRRANYELSVEISHKEERRTFLIHSTRTDTPAVSS